MKQEWNLEKVINSSLADRKTNNNAKTHLPWLAKQTMHKRYVTIHVSEETIGLWCDQPV